MAEAVAVEQATLGSGVLDSPGQKRKRGAESSSPESRRAKRGVASGAMPAPLEVTGGYLEANDTAHLANTISAEFSALQQATHDHPDASDPANASSTAAAALGSMYPTLHVPQSTEETFAAQANESDHHADNSYNPPGDMSHNDSMPVDTSAASMQASNGVSKNFAPGAHHPKPAVGSEEWHKMRKDNHKEVERRRRETINEGINELAKIVPGCEKNKGSILQRAVSFISQLKENETQNIEKWTLEKLLTEQAINELSASNDKLKAEVERLYRELETWKRVAQNAGLQPPNQKDDAT